MGGEAAADMQVEHSLTPDCLLNMEADSHSVKIRNRGGMVRHESGLGPNGI